MEVAKMKILITGNLGYVGSVLTKKIKEEFENSYIIGVDLALFKGIIQKVNIFERTHENIQIYKDVRLLDENDIENINAIIYLSAVSNDPMGNKYEKATLDINYKSAIRLAKIAKEKGVSKFIFASSCSIYGNTENQDYVNESSNLLPLTAYAKSKVYAEKDLESLADKNFLVTCLRFATACGFSDCMRLDLVINDFVASAITTGKIEILSDGTPWRPFIHVEDMSRAIIWAINYNQTDNYCLKVNVGSNKMNFKVGELAQKMSEIIGNVDVEIKGKYTNDKRSYKVSFDLFKNLAPDYQPEYNLERVVEDLLNNFKKINFNDRDSRNSYYIRLNYLNELVRRNVINHNLEYI